MCPRNRNVACNVSCQPIFFSALLPCPMLLLLLLFRCHSLDVATANILTVCSDFNLYYGFGFSDVYHSTNIQTSTEQKLTVFGQSIQSIPLSFDGISSAAVQLLTMTSKWNFRPWTKTIELYIIIVFVCDFGTCGMCVYGMRVRALPLVWSIEIHHTWFINLQHSKLSTQNFALRANEIICVCESFARHLSSFTIYLSPPPPSSLTSTGSLCLARVWDSNDSREHGDEQWR